MKGIVFILIGPPGSGKTTWAKKQRLPIISIDKARFEIAGCWNFHPPNEELKKRAFELAVKKSIRYLKSGKSIIWDGTNAAKKERRTIISHLTYFTNTFIGVLFTCSLKECLTRNVHRRRGRIEEAIIVDRFNKLINEPVTSGEGFNSIIYID